MRLPLISPEEVRALSHRWRASQDTKALGRLIESHVALVVRIAQEFRGAGPAIEDLIQEGHVGLAIAARRFDPDRGVKLSTYASFWVRAYMLEHVVRSHGPVRLGTTRNTRRIFFGLGRARRRLEAAGVDVTPEMLARELGVETDDVEGLLPRFSGHDVELDAPLHADNPRTVGDFLATTEASPERAAEDGQTRDEQRRQLTEAMETLSERERVVIEKRHLTETPKTLAEIGRNFGCSRERVRQLEERALVKIRRFLRENENTGESTTGVESVAVVENAVDDLAECRAVLRRRIAERAIAKSESA